MRERSWSPGWMGLTLLLALGGGAEASAQSAAAEFAAEAAELENDIAVTRTAWAEQRRLYQALLDAAADVEAGMGDPDATAKRLRALEDRYSVALEAAVRQARWTSDSRRRVYDGMERLAAAGRRVEREKNAVYDAPMPGGLWRLEVPDSDLSGLLRLTLDGATVRGDYRLSNGRHGSVGGTFVNGRLELVRVDSVSGRDATLNADLVPGAGRLDGMWQRFELASGEPSMGYWTAIRLGPGDEVPDLGGN